MIPKYIEIVFNNGSSRTFNNKEVEWEYTPTTFYVGLGHIAYAIPYTSIKEIIFKKSDVDVSTITNNLKALEQEPYKDMGEVSDGYHTFNQLYHQRAVLFATIVKQNKDKSWKSFKHFDGKYCFDSNGEWFIVGIDTPKGSYTYHYSKEYWDMFDCKELECGKEWDGHTEEDVTRLLSLEQEPILDKIRAEIKALSPEPTAYDVVDGNPIKDAIWETLADVLKIIDKYKAGEE